jgi:hypothetical protein
MLVLFISLTISSCRKDRTCTCTTTWTNTNEQIGGTIVTSGNYTETHTVKKQTKKQAESGVCSSYDTKKVESTSSGTETDETKTTCTLDK